MPTFPQPPLLSRRRPPLPTFQLRVCYRVQVQKGDLVAGYVNQTAMKTAKKIREVGSYGRHVHVHMLV